MVVNDVHHQKKNPATTIILFIPRTYLKLLSRVFCNCNIPDKFFFLFLTLGIKTFTGCQHTGRLYHKLYTYSQVQVQGQVYWAADCMCPQGAKQPIWVFKTSNICSLVCTDIGSHQVHLLRLTGNC